MSGSLDPGPHRLPAGYSKLYKGSNIEWGSMSWAHPFWFHFTGVIHWYEVCLHGFASNTKSSTRLFPLALCTPQVPILHPINFTTFLNVAATFSAGNWFCCRWSGRGRQRADLKCLTTVGWILQTNSNGHYRYIRVILVTSEKFQTQSHERVGAVKKCKEFRAQF